MFQIALNLATVRAKIAEACRVVGRDPATVRLIAVSKTHPISAIEEAIAAGQRDFGENRVEEAAAKIAAYPDLIWHMIGHVQSRKVRDVAPRFAIVHSVDSLKLARRFSQAVLGGARPADSPLPILLEINISGEASKGGMAARNWREDSAVRAALWEEVGAVVQLPGLAPVGLMTMAPIVSDPEEARPVFSGLRELRDALAESFPHADWGQLSMGMTDDYLIAIQEGSTMVRIGRAIFGERR
jgi:pyridoxal phosphate enzyme (YggS family)